MQHNTNLIIVYLFIHVTAVCWLVSTTSLAFGAPVTPAEKDLAHRWATGVFTGAKRPGPERHATDLVVLANNDPVQANARNGQALNIAGVHYRRGLYCHATSKVAVRLGKPARLFRAVVGVDSNQQTRGGRGSVVFAIRIGKRRVWKSGKMREGMPGVPVSVDLYGATEVVLEIDDAGDGNSCDQSDWAEARVTLEDDTTIDLGDLVVEQPDSMRIGTELPFRFTFDGKPSTAFLDTWKTTREARNLDALRTEYRLNWADPATGLEVRCSAVEYHDFPTIEWTIHFRNSGSKETPVIADIRPLDMSMQRFPWPTSDWSEFRLHHHTGSPCTPTDYRPFATSLSPEKVLRFAPSGGRPSDSVLPYFNLELPTSEGLILAVGWPGQWVADFTRDAHAGIRLRAGQERTHFVLHPGEEVRTPLIVLQFWKGDWVRAQNIWRQWMLVHNLPHPGGTPPPPHLAACSSHQFGEMIHADEDNQRLFIDRYIDEGIHLDYWWMDAGWYVNKTGWPNTGTWEVDKKRFPHGLRAITDHGHDRDVKSIVWFEPERVTPGTRLYEEHPDWLLGRDGEQKLLDLGNPDARQWLTEHVDSLIREQGIDLYRNDFNIDPLPFWRANDTPDRQGVTEIRYVDGFLAWWDELRRRHPHMLIDTCASGGRRNDLETLRRAVPLLRSDYIFEPVSQQLHTYGIAFWIPFHGTGLTGTDPYTFRSQMCPALNACYDVRRRDIDYALLRRLVKQWREIAPFYFGDYYPLTPYSTGHETWMAWQFHRPDRGTGMVQVFRRDESIYESARLRLRGLNPAAKYRVHDIGTDSSTVQAGHDLMQQGLHVVMEKQPGARVIVYERVTPATR